MLLQINPAAILQLFTQREQLQQQQKELKEQQKEADFFIQTLMNVASQSPAAGIPGAPGAAMVNQLGVLSSPEATGDAQRAQLQANRAAPRQPTRTTSGREVRADILRQQGESEAAIQVPQDPNEQAEFGMRILAGALPPMLEIQRQQGGRFVVDEIFQFSEDFFPAGVKNKPNLVAMLVNDETGENVPVRVEVLPEGITEGSVLVGTENPHSADLRFGPLFKVDPAETRKRLRDAQRLLNKLKKDAKGKKNNRKR